MLRIAVQNSEVDIANHKLGRQIIRVQCQRCGHRWAGRLEDISCEPNCPKCKS